MSWQDEYFSQDDAKNDGYPYLNNAEVLTFNANFNTVWKIDGTSYPALEYATVQDYDGEGVYTAWGFNNKINKGYPFLKLALLPSDTFPGKEYWEACNKATRETKMSGTITLTDETEIEITDSDIKNGTFTKESACCTTNIMPGTASCAEYAFTLLGDYDETNLYGARVDFKFSLKVNGSWYDIPMSPCYITEVTQTSGKCFEVRGSDAMMLFEKELPEFDDGYLTLFEIVTACAEDAGVDVKQTEEEYANECNGKVKFEVSKCASEYETSRDLLESVAQIMCGFFFIDMDGVLTFRAFKDGSSDVVTTMDKNQRMRSSVSKFDYVLHELRMTTEIDAESMDEKNLITYVEETLYEAGVTVELEDNPMWNTIAKSSTQSRANAVGVAFRNILTQLETVKIRPFDMTVKTNPALELFDWVTHAEQKAPLTSYRWVYHGQSSIGLAGADEIAGIAKQKAQKRADRQRKDSVADYNGLMHYTYVALMGTHEQAHNFTNYELSHFLHSEIGGKKNG